jgi:hypothetical protein
MNDLVEMGYEIKNLAGTLIFTVVYKNLFYEL